MTARAAGRPAWRAGDFLALGKPRITVMAVVIAAMAFVLAPGWPGPLAAFASLAGIALVVAAANTLNQYLERDVDALMERTRERPLPAGRLDARAGLAFGLVLGTAALAVLAWSSPLTAALALVALVNYVCIYTPMKRRTSWAVAVGAVSGAMPILLGWTAAAGAVDATALVLFAILFVWQLPHFVAISVFRKDEYDRAGIRVVPTTQGPAAARVHAVAWTALLVPLSLALVPTADAGWLYVALAVTLDVWFLARALGRLRGGLEAARARSYFHASLVYMPLLVVGLLVDAALR